MSRGEGRPISEIRGRYGGQNYLDPREEVKGNIGSQSVNRLESEGLGYK